MSRLVLISEAGDPKVWVNPRSVDAVVETGTTALPSCRVHLRGGAIAVVGKASDVRDRIREAGKRKRGKASE